MKTIRVPELKYDVYPYYLHRRLVLNWFLEKVAVEILEKCTLENVVNGKTGSLSVS